MFGLVAGFGWGQVSEGDAILFHSNMARYELQSNHTKCVAYRLTFNVSLASLLPTASYMYWFAIETMD